MKAQEVLKRLGIDDVISNMTFIGKETSDSYNALRTIKRIVRRIVRRILNGLNNTGITKRSWINDSMLDTSNIMIYLHNYTYRGCGEKLLTIPLVNLYADDLKDFESAIYNINKNMSLSLFYYIDENSMCIVFSNRALNSAIRNYSLVKYDEQALVNDAISTIVQHKSTKKLSDFTSELKLISLLSDGTVITVMGNEADYDNLNISGIIRDVTSNELTLEDIDTLGKLIRVSFNEGWKVTDIRKMLLYQGDGTIRMSVPRLKVINNLQDSEDVLPF